MKCEENVDLKKLNTYRIGGTAKYLVKPGDIKALKNTIEELNEKNIKYYVLGGGSNVILPDEDFDGAIIKLDKINTFLIKDSYVFASSGLSLNEFIKKCLDEGYTNFSNLYGIPGSLGGAIVGNAGANESEIFADLCAVLVYENGLIKLINKENIKYGYRYTEFKNSNVIVLGAIFKLVSGNVDNAWLMIKENLEKRKKTQPLEYPSAGSVFKNPEGLSAGKLIDECGLKEKTKGGAKVSKKHANFIINENNATSYDIITLINEIKEEVKKQKHVELELEQVIVKW